ncbi:DNA-binding SARP family transcriptional activator [Allocatelliglobosispora scoriae]|uniref:DNA-binding SARP family transcriptional activator n=1 Tax=Allocatelliglobosispora scoriae TaxID=643052 RepID=A0A841BMT3_9ACTN|nr:AfsR/SARP family transcriptional regulator [Allocatelliglobosispora scoriae]MBB5868688.1 DNA-binding SARP family transcriptional activator [Allocatelliglobosispora scoriae]
MSTVEIRLLGPLQVSGDGGAVVLGGPRQRTILGLLALRVPQVVSCNALVDGVWDTAPPGGAAKTLRAHIAYLRRGLLAGGAGSPIATRAPGYTLAVPAEWIDVHCFEYLVGRGHAEAASGSPEAAAAYLRRALGLWRGEALADCAAGQWAQAEVARLQEMRLNATEELLAAELELGRCAQVAAELIGLVARHPLRERMWELLMIALYRAGRPGEALHAYRRARETLAEELGMEPGARLRRLEVAILSGE